jgi:glutathione S-transferase
VKLVLHSVPGSHPCQTVERALELKGLAYERVDLLPGASQVQQRVRFGKRTVPGLEVDGYRVSGSRLIMRTLDGLRPEPRLYPEDPAAAAAVEAADEWGDGPLQGIARLTILYAIGHRPDSGPSFMEGANVPQLPAFVSEPFTRALFAVEVKLLAGGPPAVQKALADLPAALDHADSLIAAGTIGGDQPNAADLQIGGSIRLMLTLEDLRAGIDARPSGQLARRLFSRYPGSVPAGTFPREWLPDLAARVPAAAAAAS